MNQENAHDCYFKQCLDKLDQENKDKNAKIKEASDKFILHIIENCFSKDQDYESDHKKADEAIIRFLDELELYGASNAYQDVNKWYS